MNEKEEKDIRTWHEEGPPRIKRGERRKKLRGRRKFGRPRFMKDCRQDSQPVRRMKFMEGRGVHMVHLRSQLKGFSESGMLSEKEKDKIELPTSFA